jgi:phage tail protein X
MALIYKTKDGDILDKIILDTYGFLRPGMVELVLSVNPNLADYGAEMPSGLSVVLPDINPSPVTTIRLWS